MGPLIPMGIIDPAWNNVIAVIIGFGFGFILERSGFSNARKIVGVFYGYDFTVLRVFMTAVGVAMVGLLYFSYLGWIDLSMLFINPMFFWSVLIGSVIMGVGFLFGGYCPGTSLTGAAIGKKDALMYTAGMYIGILLFSEAFPLYAKIYTLGAKGPLLITEWLGIKANLFAFIFIIAMLSVFVFIYLIRNKMRKVEL
jgi:uncharacterized protein